MSYASKEALMEYTQPKKHENLSIQIMGVFCCIVGAFSFTIPGGFGMSLLMTLGGAAMVVFFHTKTYSSYKNFFSLAASTGELNEVINDFGASRSMADDRIRLGQIYLYGKQAGRPIKYAELKKVYVSGVQKSTNVFRRLHGVTADGTDILLCEFILHDSAKKPQPDEAAILQHIKSKNPYIVI